MESFSPAFCSRDFILRLEDDTIKIRDSFSFNQLYQSEHYVNYHKERYRFFDNLNEFNYNYNYQIGSNPEDIDNLLTLTATNLPPYLARMEKDIVPKIQNIKNTLHKAIATTKTNEQASFDANNELKELTLRKVSQSSVKLFASYPAFIKNGKNPVYLKFKNVLKDICSKLSPEDLNSF